MKKTKLAIFDLDGTLFDTTECNFQAYRQACKESHVNIDREYYESKCHSKNYKVFMPSLVGDNIELREKIHDRKIELYPSFLGTAKVNKHLFKIIESLRPSYRIAIATTASRQNAEAILRHFGKLSLFEMLVCGEDAEKTKPNPECFLKVMEFFNMSPENTVIFEDSEIGIQAATATKSTVMVIEQF
ncbi:MAG: HAD family phosphatase [Micrococcaceae bacterium]